MKRGDCLQGHFDEVYYRICYADLLGDEPDLYKHYAEVGVKAGLNPNPFFSTQHYIDANLAANGKDCVPLDHFRTSPPPASLAVSPLFDPKFYARENPEVRPGKALFEHYLDRGAREGRAPNALFDPAHYRAQLASGFDPRADLLTHYLTEGWKAGLAPHPLFDPEYYRAQLSGDALKIPPLAHYFERGWRDGLSPHVLFDPRYYEENLDRPLREPALAHYLNSTRWEATPHYLFSDTYYLAAVERSALRNSTRDYRSGAPLLHYVRTGARYGISPHPLFDVGFYRHAAERLIREQDDPTAGLADLEADALRHYCESGVERGLSPTPLFDREFYAARIGEPIAGDPFRRPARRSGLPPGAGQAAGIGCGAGQSADDEPLGECAVHARTGEDAGRDDRHLLRQLSDESIYNDAYFSSR